MEKKVKWGILATGTIAHAFARGLKQCETGVLHAVASRSTDKAEAFAKKFDVPKFFGSYEAMLADPEVEVVYVSTPHPMHLEWVLKCFDAGKHVLCEKPAGMNQWELQKMIVAARQKNLFFMEAFMYRCHPQTAMLAKLVREGAIGKVCAIDSTFSYNAPFNAESRSWKNDLGGGGIMDVGCYPVSLSRLIAGATLGKDFAEPWEVRGSAAMNNPARVDAYSCAVMKFEGEIIATVHAGVGLGQDGFTRIWGTEGQIYLPYTWVSNWEQASTGKIVVTRNGKEEIFEPKADVMTFALEADVAGRAIRAGRVEAAEMSWQDSLGNARALDSWRKSAWLVYDLEKPERIFAGRAKKPVVPNSLKPSIPREQIKGLSKPASKLAVGVLYMDDMLHTDAMFGAYMEHGGNLFDTSWHYGQGLSTLFGEWVNRTGVRDDVVLIAKGAHTPNCYPDSLRGQVYAQLDWLGFTHADIYIMHRDNPDVPVGEFVDVLNELVKEGRFQIFGGSNWSLDRIEAANAYAKARGLQGFSVLSNNLALAEMVNPVWPGCIHNHSRLDRDRILKMGITCIPWSSQARGFFLPEISRPDLRKDGSLVSSWYSDDNFKRQARAIELAKKYNAEPINIALAWVLQQKFPCFPLIGPRSLMELFSSMKALEINLTDDEMAWLNLEAN